MSRRNINRILDFDNSNKDKLLSVLDEKPELFKSLQACVYLRDNPLEYYDGLSTLDYYEIYKLITDKIVHIFKMFFPGTSYSKWEIYNEFLLRETSELNIKFLENCALETEMTVDQLINQINGEKEKGKSEIVVFSGIDGNGKHYYDKIKIFIDELQAEIDKFLSNYKNIKCKINDGWDYIEIIYSIPNKNYDGSSFF